MSNSRLEHVEIIRLDLVDGWATTTLDITWSVSYWFFFREYFSKRITVTKRCDLNVVNKATHV